MKPQRSVIVLACIALAIGLVEPALDIMWRCRAGLEASEACVWGKSLLPLGRIVGVVVIAPLIFVVLMIGRQLWRSRASRSQPYQGAR